MRDDIFWESGGECAPSLLSILTCLRQFRDRKGMLQTCLWDRSFQAAHLLFITSVSQVLFWATHLTPVDLFLFWTCEARIFRMISQRALVNLLPDLKTGVPHHNKSVPSLAIKAKLIYHVRKSAEGSSLPFDCHYWTTWNCVTWSWKSPSDMCWEPGDLLNAALAEARPEVLVVPHWLV